MAKGSKSIFFCQNCGHESAKWMGQCPACHAWNSFVEEVLQTKPGQGAAAGTKRAKDAPKPKSLDEISLDETNRILTGIGELDRVLGGGIVAGSLTLIGGDPGIGKSTLLLQVCRQLAEQNRRVLYVSGEESLRQIKMRAERIGSFREGLQLLCETSLDLIEQVIEKERPQAVVIDSIQTMYNESVSSSPGSVSQVRESTAVLLRIAKGMQIPVFIVGHVTKDGNVAGPRVLEHMVDTVLYFEGDRNASYRILRAVKNRFGSTNEIGVFEMRGEGLAEVANPSEFMLEGRAVNASGSVVSCSMEGSRPIMLEVQALACHSNFGFPRRTANGTDFNRVNLLVAVLERRARVNLSAQDVYVNIAGGVKMTEPAVDLGILLAIVSSVKDLPLDSQTVVFGEVGLSGEIRSVSQAQQRVNEAEKLGFKTVILPAANLRNLEPPRGSEIRLVGVETVSGAIRAIRP
ncbi:MAG: DNA repair protein RadA [Eubacterium sp.]|nr:DNA repair protein RadA [Eubacterium sp.]